MNFCKYVNVFQGNDTIDLPKPKGIAAKWFFIKAGCGNTSPAAVLPFGAMSVAPFSGGYPTGYGNHRPNSHSLPPIFDGGEKIYGFAHLQQSGTGAIGYYYNYAVVTPRYDFSEEKRLPTEEKAVPGYYSCKLEDILCELTTTNHTAIHRYTFGSENGKITVDFSNNGLRIPGDEPAKADVTDISIFDKNTVTATAEIEGVTLHFAVRASTEAKIKDNKAVFCYGAPSQAEVKLAISLLSQQKAVEFINNTPDFSAALHQANDLWESELSKIRIETDNDDIKEIFYSNLYHSLIKPCDRTGESFMYPNKGAFLVDFNTLWDMYKTALPLIFMLNADIAQKTAETLMSLCDELGLMPNSFGISDEYKLPTEQARMLGAYALITAYRYGIKLDVKRMLNTIKTDLFASNKYDFTRKNSCASHTWLLDMADACALTAQIAAENGDMELADLLAPYAELWKKAYSEETGLLKADSIYYEGTLYNYSFRQMVNMDERIELAGGKEKFTALLDKFFGYGEPDVTQPTNPHDYSPVDEGIKLGRFEGFNNESDTEAPFSYIYAGRHDRTCEVLRSGMKYMYTKGKGGIPGNNDSGALSSYYVFAALGIFPVAGQDLFLLGSPFVDSAEIRLSSGKTLYIKVNGNSDENIYVKEAFFNGNKIKDCKITAKEIMNGGRLEFTMTKENKK